MLNNLKQRKEICSLLLDNNMTFEVIGHRIYADGTKTIVKSMLPANYTLIKAERGCWEILPK